MGGESVTHAHTHNSSSQLRRWKAGSMWIEALVVLGNGSALREREEGGAAEAGAGPGPLSNRASIVKCIPEEARAALPPQLSVCCLPRGVQRKPFHHRSLDKYCEQYNVILTDQMGNKTFGYCCTFFDTCAASNSRSERSEDEGEFAYLKCLCLISKDPLYKTFETLVQTIYTSCFRQKSLLSCDYDLLGDIVTRINALPRSPAPAPPLHVILPIGRATLQLELQCVPKESPSPIQLTQLLQMDRKVLLVLFESILLERKVILRSRSKAKLSDTSEALCELLFPLKWQHIYIPIVPEGLTEYLEAPTPYLMGVLSSISTENLNYEQSIEIDIDKSSYTFGKDFSLSFSDEMMLMRKCLDEMASRHAGGHGGTSLQHWERDLRALFLETVTKLLLRARAYFSGEAAFAAYGGGGAGGAGAGAAGGEEFDAQKMDFLQAFTETQMCHIFFQDSPEMLDADALRAMKGRMKADFSLASQAAALGKAVEIVTFQSLQPSVHVGGSFGAAKTKAAFNTLEHGEAGAGGYSDADFEGLPKLQVEAMKSERLLDYHDSGLYKGADGAGAASTATYNERAEELFDCLYLFFQVKYGNLLFDTNSSIVRQCIDSVGSAEYLAAIVSAFKFTIMGSKDKVIRFSNLEAMQKLMFVFIEIVMKALHSFDHLLAFGMLATSLYIKHASRDGLENGIRGFDFILDELPTTCSFWGELISLIMSDAEGLEAGEPASACEFCSDLLLLCSELFPDDPWYESSLQFLLETLIEEDIESDDLKMMLSISKMKPRTRAECIGNDLGLSLGSGSLWNVVTRFEPRKLDGMEVASSAGKREPSKHLPRSPVNSIDSKSGIIITSTCDGKTRLYSNQKQRNGSRLSDQLFVLKQKAGRNLVKFSLDGTKFYVLSSHRIGIWDTSTCKNVRSTEGDEDPSCVSICKNAVGKDFLIIGNSQGLCKLWDHLSSASVASLSFHGHSDRISKISYLDNGQHGMFISSSRDGRSLLWDARKNNTPLYTMVSHDSWITDHKVFHLKGVPYMVCGSCDWTSSVWNLRTGKLKCTYDGHTSPVETVTSCTSENAEDLLIASGDRDGEVHLWGESVDGTYSFGQTRSVLKTCSDAVLRVGYQPLQNSLVACYGSNALTCWDVSNQAGASVLDLECRAYCHSRQSFTACRIDQPAGFVYSGCANGDVLSWNMESTVTL